MRFPNTPVLDTFNRANESPLSGGGNWAANANWWGDPLELVSNQIKMPSGATGGYAGSYWTASQFSGKPEWFCDVAVAPTGVDYINFELIDASSDFAGGTPNGYLAAFSLGETLKLWRWDAGAASQIAITSIVLGDGDGIGLKVDPVGHQISMYHRAASNGIWVRAARVTDANHGGANWIGSIGISGTSIRLDNVGGGSA